MNVITLEKTHDSLRNSSLQTPEEDYCLFDLFMCLIFKYSNGLCSLRHHIIATVIISPHSACDDEVNGTRVALKKLARPFHSEIFAKRAYREIRMLRHFRHENVSTFIVSMFYERCDISETEFV